MSEIDPARAERLRRLHLQAFRLARELPADPDEDALPDDFLEYRGVWRDRPLRISGVDPETGQRYEGLVTVEDLARGFADARRLREDAEL